MTFPNRLDLTVLINLRDNENVIELNGTTSDYLRNDSFFWSANNFFTVEGWIESEDTGQEGTLFCYSVPADVAHVLIHDYTDIEITVKGVSSGSTGIALNDGVPHHVAISRNPTSGMVIFYVDGKPRWSGVLGTGTLTTGGYVTIGQEVSSYPTTYQSGSSFLGKLYEWRMWSDLRTEREVFENMQLRLEGSADDLHHSWAMDEGTGTTAVDDSLNEDLTLSSSGLWTTTETPFFTDITDDINPPSLTMGSTLGKAVDTAQFTMRTWSGQPPREWDEIAIKDGATFVFGGFVTSISESDDADVLTKFSVGCSDYGIYLDYILLKEEYEDTDDQTIILALMAEYAPWIGVADVEKLKDYERYRINRRTLRQVLNVMADDAGGDWYVDPYKDLHFFASYNAIAPFNLSEAPNLTTTMPYHGLVEHRGGSGLVNRIEIIGGWYLSPDGYFYLLGTGEDNRVIMPFKMHAPDGETSIQVWRNDGSEVTPSWTVMTVKVGHIDELAGATDVLYYFQEQVLEQQSDWPAFTNAVRLYGKIEIPLRTRLRDYDSFDFYKRWFDDYVSDDTITDKASAILRAKAVLAERSMGNLALTVHTREPGLRAGQQINLYSTQFGVDDDFIIQRVSAQVNINGRVDYSLSLGVWNDDLVDMLLEITRQTRKPPVWREDEVLDEVIDYRETFELSETTYTPTTNPTTGPYRWGAVGSGEIPLIWDFGQWEA